MRPRYIILHSHFGTLFETDVMFIDNFPAICESRDPKNTRGLFY